ncbi:hypothetical protein RvY_14412 [Ramazzottius varieornatus]|uniref:Uncharacterized protein n=1 Tax=Ramazzottius varieornatus TaxID=947166 RepID=A0A1D1VT74_RAMVA|nr:hypothetical protein RvY_14412 [Ramazzottius varieornatus]
MYKVGEKKDFAKPQNFLGHCQASSCLWKTSFKGEVTCCDLCAVNSWCQEGLHQPERVPTGAEEGADTPGKSTIFLTISSLWSPRTIRMTAYSFAEAVDCITIYHGIHLDYFYLHPSPRSVIAVAEAPWSPTPFRESNSSCYNVCAPNSCALKVYHSLKEAGMIPKAVQPGARIIIPCTDCSYIRGWKASKTTVTSFTPEHF